MRQIALNLFLSFPLMARGLFRLLLAVSIYFAGSTATAEIAVWDEPDLDRWFHQGETNPGGKTELSTFASLAPGSQTGQSRSGTAVVGFDTRDSVPLVSADRYQIHSVTLTASYVFYASATPREVIYDPTADLLEDDDPGRPIELFGAGFANDYQRLGWGDDGGIDQPPEFEEGSPLLSSEEGESFNIFPLGDDGTGALGNVFNSSGGEGIFDAEGELVEIIREPWDTTPWATGTVAGLEAGEIIPSLAEFSFELDLNLPSVLNYLQDSLSEGHLAFFLSSLHEVSVPDGHTGPAESDFPAFYSRESLIVQEGFAPAIGLTVEYDILAESPAGDFDGNGVVDTWDLAKWRSDYGINSDSDADGDGHTDGSDFLIWQRNFDQAAAAGGLYVVPEPTTLWLLVFTGGFGFPRVFFKRRN